MNRIAIDYNSYVSAFIPIKAIVRKKITNSSKKKKNYSISQLCFIDACIAYAYG